MSPASHMSSLSAFPAQAQQLASRRRDAASINGVDDCVHMLSEKLKFDNPALLDYLGEIL